MSGQGCLTHDRTPTAHRELPKPLVTVSKIAHETLFNAIDCRVPISIASP